MRGFGTLDITRSDGHGAQFPTLSATPATLNKGKTNFDSSVFGLQGDYSLTDKLDFTIQVVSTAQVNGSYAPSIEWAYLNYDFGNDLHLHAGKMMLSLLQGTELRYVGFSRLWVRPLVPTSGAGGFDHFMGANLLKGTSIGDYAVRFQASYGKADAEQSFIHNHDVKLISSRIEQGESWIGFSLMQARYGVADKKLGNILKRDAAMLMGGVETQMLLGNTIINGGIVRSKADINPDERLGYLSLGYRMGRFTPYLLQSQRRLTHDASQMLAVLPPRTPGSPPLPPLVNGINKTDTVAMGFRYDVAAKYAIKGQLDRWATNDNSKPLTGTVKLKGNLFTLVLDVVF